MRFPTAPEQNLTAALWRRRADFTKRARYLCFLCVFSLCFVVMTSIAEDDGEWAFWMSNLVFFGVMLNYCIFIRSGGDMFEPVILVGLIYLMAFVGRAMCLYVKLDQTNINNWVRANLHLLGQANAYIVAGLAFFALGYYLPIGNTLAKRFYRVKTTWNMDLLGKRAVLIYCLCLPTKLLILLPPGTYAFQNAITSRLGSMITLVASLTDVALLLYAIYYYHHRKAGVIRGKTAFYVMLCIQLLAGFLTGYREPLFITLMALVFVRHYMWKPMSIARVLGAAFVLMLVITPISRSYRSLREDQQQDIAPAIANLSDEVGFYIQRQYALENDSAAGYALRSAMTISNRFHGTDSLIACMATVPKYVDYQQGRTLYLLPLTLFVPRAVWPGKPKIGLGTYFRDNIWKGPRSNYETAGQIAITQMGELYINFGVGGILAGMLVLGVIHRFAYSHFRENFPGGNYTSLLFYFVAILCFLAVERNIALAYGYLIKVSICLYLLCKYLNGGPVFYRAMTRGQTGAASYSRR